MPTYHTDHRYPLMLILKVQFSAFGSANSSDDLDTGLKPYKHSTILPYGVASYKNIFYFLSQYETFEKCDRLITGLKPL